MLAPTYLKLILVAVIWGGQFAAARYVAPYLPPYTAGALRYLLALAVLAVLLGRLENGWPRLSARDWGVMTLLGAIGVFLYNAFFFAALEHIAASRAILVSSFGTPAIAVVSWAVFRTRLDYLRWFGIAIAVIGVCVVVSQGDPASLLSGAIGIGDVYIVGSVGSWVAYAIITRIVMQRFEPLHTFAFTALPGTAMLVAAAIIERPWQALADLHADGWLAVLYLGTVGTVITMLWFLQGAQRIGPARAQIFMNLAPVFGVFFGWWLLDEPLLPSIVIGGVLVLLGVALTNQPARAEPAVASRS